VRRLTTNLEDTEAAELDALAARLDRSLAWVIRLAVLNLLAECAQKSAAEQEVQNGQ